MGAMAISYDITVDHSSGGLGTPPYGTVTLNQDGTGVDFTVHINTGYSFVLTGAADFMDFKFNATGVALGDITITHDPSTYTLVAQTGTFTGDGTGKFGFGITGSTQKNGGAGAFTGDIGFNVADSTISDFTQANNLGFLFVVDLLGPNGSTGPAAVPGNSRTVPDGGVTAMLLSASLTGIALIRRKFIKV